MRIAFYLYTLLSAAGIYISERLIAIHLDTHYAKAAGDTGICSGEGFSCADAASSEYAEIFGFPIAALGLAFYITALVMAGVARFSEDLRGRLFDLFLLGGLASVGYSIFLAVVSAVDIGKLCPFCMGLYGVNLGLFLTAGFTHPEGWGGGFKRIGGALTSKAFGLTAVVMVIAVLASQGVYAHRAEASKRARVQQQVEATRPTGPVEVEVGRSMAKGPADAAVVVVEFSNLLCPHCMHLAEGLAEARESMGDDLRYHFKHFPMDAKCNRGARGSGSLACEAHVAVVCAQRMGKGWAMHDKVFAHQRSLTPDIFARLAGEIGVDVEAFGACMGDPSAMDEVKADVEQGIALGVHGTPVWFANGWRENGARDPQTLEAILRERLRQAQKPKP